MSEATAEEFKEGTAQPVGATAFGESVEKELMKPLDPARVRTREGRGKTKLEYLAGHDVKRRANELFGFGCWGSRIVELVELAAVEVEKNGKPGWHVGYRCTVEVWIAGMESVISDTGYGDAVEYTPAARVTAHELASKEASTDALKRALTQLGDQFGLILYAKTDERARIATQETVEDAGKPVLRPGAPKGWKGISEAFMAANPVEDWQAWVREACLLANAVEDRKALDAPTQAEFGTRLANTASFLLEASGGEGAFPPANRQEIRQAFASAFDGIVLEGPKDAVGEAMDAIPGMAEAMDAAEADDP